MRQYPKSKHIQKQTRQANTPKSNQTKKQKDHVEGYSDPLALYEHKQISIKQKQPIK
jgi:hypothetical protein